MSCKFCFATFQGVRNSVLPAGHLPKQEALRLVSKLAAAGFRKINFAGGEPFLCPWLDELIQRAKEEKMVTSVVTNGSLMNWNRVDEVLPHLDWFVLSVDSLNPQTLRKMGRVTPHGPLSSETYLAICRRIRNHEIRLKINTVVTSVNRRENLTEFVREAAPHRWKIMQVLPLTGSDVRNPRAFTVTSRQFKGFLRANKLGRKSAIQVVPERDYDMVGSYVMVDPAGRFYDNTQGEYRYSTSILDTDDIQGLLSGMNVSTEAFEKRGGSYDFQPPIREIEAPRTKSRTRKIISLDQIASRSDRKEARPEGAVK